MMNGTLLTNTAIINYRACVVSAMFKQWIFEIRRGKLMPFVNQVGLDVGSNYLCRTSPLRPFTLEDRAVVS